MDKTKVKVGSIEETPLIPLNEKTTQIQQLC
jgi:hypothetical protein